MFVNLAIIVLLSFGFKKGWRRGFVMQVVYMSSFILSLLFARYFYNQFGLVLEKIIPIPVIGKGEYGELLQSLFVDSMFYNVLAFSILVFVGRLIIHRISRVLNIFTRFPVISTLNRMLGAGLSFIERYIIIFFILLGMFLIKSTKVYIYESTLALMILEKTPFLSEFIKMFISVS